MTAPLIHICGWPGSGKRTIARALQDRIGGRVLDNHLILDPASALFDRGTPERGALRERLRALLYDAAVKVPPDEPLILTDALAQSDRHSNLVAPTLALAERRGAVLVPIVLEIDIAENVRRLSDPARKGTGKLTDPAILHELRGAHELLELPGAHQIDVSELSAAEAADRIAAHLPVRN